MCSSVLYAVLTSFSDAELLFDKILGKMPGIDSDESIPPPGRLNCEIDFIPLNINLNRGHEC